MNSERLESQPQNKKEEILEKVFGRGEFKFGVGEDVLLHVVIRRDKEVPNEAIVEEISFEDKYGKIKSLLEFLPEGWRIVLYDMPQMQASADHLHKVIKLPCIYMRESSRIVPESEELPQPGLERVETLFGETFYSRRVINIEKLRKVRVLERMPIFQENPVSILTLLHEVGHARHPDHKDLPEDFHERSKHLLLNKKRGLEVVPEERDAWAFAIKIIRGLKKEGFNFGDAFSKENIERSIQYPLMSYHDPKTMKKVDRDRGNV